MPKTVQSFAELKDFDDNPREMYDPNPSIMTFDEFVIKRAKPSIKVVFCSKRNKYFEGGFKYDLPPIFLSDGCGRDRKYLFRWLAEKNMTWTEVADELGIRGGSIAVDVDINSLEYHTILDKLEYPFGEPISQNIVVWQMDIDVARTYQQARNALLGGKSRSISL